jgi:hypothetical protein
VAGRLTSGPDDVVGSTRGGADPSRWLAVSLVSACMALLDVSIVNVAVR